MSALTAEHDALLFDLDGTLFRGGVALPGAPEELAAFRRDGVRIGFLTNNGSRSATEVAEHLRSLGFVADEREVVTSGQAAARLLADRLEPGCAVFVVGTASLAGEVTAVGLTVTDSADSARAVVQGHSPDTSWRRLAEACLAIRAGALWVACNVDLTLPDERGELPGNGSMVAALRAATGARPEVAGKPEPALYREAVRRAGARRPLVVGDRLDTDIAGANALSLPSLLVLTGVSTAEDVLTAPEELRPTHLGADLATLRAESKQAQVGQRPEWSARPDERALVLTAGDGPPDALDALRTLCAVHWANGGGPVTVRAGDQAATQALAALGLPQGTVLGGTG